MNIPYKKNPLYSYIDWEKFFAIQANSESEKIGFDNSQNRKVKTKVNAMVNPRQRGGKRQ